MLSESLKTEIQDAYSRLLINKGYKARYCQKVMIAEIARTLANAADMPSEDNPALKNEASADETSEEGEHQEAEQPHADEGNICVVEAGTGTGKTIAYALAAIPLANALKKKVVISTVTVALQEQIVYQDLPDIRKHSGLDFSFTLVKGRRRYLCLSRLHLALQDSQSVNHTLAFYDAQGYDKKSHNRKNHDTNQSAPEQSDILLYETMRDKLDKGNWDGDRDNWSTELGHTTWYRVSTDHAQCTGKQCTHYENCCFYRARENVHRVNCVVTNHDLVLADQMMGDGGVLPAPEDAIYIFDEGHHLPEKARNHLSQFIAIYATRNWLTQIIASLKLASAELDSITPAILSQVEQRAADTGRLLDELARMLEGLYERATQDGDGRRYLFPLGVVDEEVMASCGESGRVCNGLLTSIRGIEQGLQAGLEDAEAVTRETTEHWLSVVSSITDRLAAACALWDNFAVRDNEDSPPWARWVSFKADGAAEGMEVQLSSSPISIADELQASLWSRCFGGVITSATLSVGGDFTSFRARSGVSEENRFTTLPSPFNFSEQASLHIPRMAAEPNRTNEHDQDITNLLPKLLADESGSLVLFTSRRQMLAVMESLDAEFRQRVLCQDSYSKMEIISRHKSSVDAGEPSCIFGLASFAEGIDLPGNYCSHVVLARIPFATPDDPVIATLSAWINAHGGNAFMEVSLPDAIIKMVQACGRLLRTETDTGRVTVLDRRLLTRRYGEKILSALPPFKREAD